MAMLLWGCVDSNVLLRSIVGKPDEKQNDMNDTCEVTCSHQLVVVLEFDQTSSDHSMTRTQRI
jgi:hypothetical protein